jgi:hypothetical protein
VPANSRDRQFLLLAPVKLKTYPVHGGVAGRAQARHARCRTCRGQSQRRSGVAMMAL